MMDEKEIYNKKNGFVLYKNYVKQVSKMTNEQAGELFKMILHYVNTFEMQESEDPRVDTAFDFIGERLEFEMRSYIETCQKNSENGKKGGRPPKAAAEDEDTASKKAKKPTGFSEKAKKAYTDTDTDTDTETDTDMETDTDKTTSCSNSTGGKRACVKGKRADGMILYGEDHYPTSEADITQNEALTEELHRIYLHTEPVPYDYESVFKRVYIRTELADGEDCASFSAQKADLLRHAYSEAASAHKVNWKYIDGILSHYEDYGIKTVEEAVEHEYRWKRGEIA